LVPQHVNYDLGPRVNMQCTEWAAQCWALESANEREAYELFNSSYNYVLQLPNFINPLPTKANSLKKQKSMYKVLTPNIKPPM